MKKISSMLIVLFIVILLAACGNKNVCRKEGCNQPTYQDGLCRDHWNDQQINNAVGNAANAVNNFFNK